MVGNTQVQLDTHVVESDIPLLMSRESLKRAEADIDFQRDTIKILGETIDLKISKSGHLMIPLIINTHDCFLTSPISPDNPNLEKQIHKLHKQFAHPAPNRLKQLIKNSGTNEKKVDDMIDKITSNCDTCKRYKKAPPRPVVGMPLASEFNETVAMDIKFIRNIPILHLIDHTTRYSAACKLNNKKPMSVIQAILTIWVRIFGHPIYFLFDNGGEFINSEVEELCEKFNIKIKTTAAESPWSNGLCERANAILADMVEKIMGDTDCSLDLAIPWAICAKNSLANTYGFSPNQLVFGKNINLPTTHTDSLPAGNTNRNELITQHLIALHKSRQAFINQESCEKLRRALNRQTRSYTDTNYHIGDNVYYKRNDQHEWHGPAKILGQDGSQFLLKHGGRYIRVHQCKLQLIDTGQEIEKRTNSQTTANHQLDTIHNKQQRQEENTSEESENETTVHTEDEDKNKDEPETPNEEETNHENEGKEKERNPNNELTETNTVEPDNEENIADDQVTDKETKQKLPRALQRLQDYNKPPENQEDIFFGTSTNSKRFDKAKEEEFQKWKDMKVFDEVEDTGQTRISTRWVCTERMKGGKLNLKARLVARGFEEDTSQLRSDSPTCSKESLRLLLMILASNKWNLNSMDVKGAFLQGPPISREIYLTPPTGLQNGKLWKLNKTPYGLVDAGRKWYIKIVEEFTKLGASCPITDKALFNWKDQNNNLIGILISHVDDFLFGGNIHFNKEIVPTIRSTFSIGLEETGSMKYLGLQIDQNTEHISLGIKEYKRELEEIDTTNFGSDKTRTLEPKEITLLRSKIGQINWITNQSRPDMAFDSCIASNSTKNPTINDILLINKIIRKMGGQNIVLKYPNKLQIKKSHIVAFCDASHANLPDRGSQGAYLIFIIDEIGHYCLISWQSKRIKRVVNSSLAAECLSAVETAEECMLIKTTMKHLLGIQMSIHILSDNKSLVDATHTTNQMENKRLQIDISILREMMENQEIHQFRWIDTKHQLANALTKNGASPEYLLRVLRQQLKFDFNSGVFA